LQIEVSENQLFAVTVLVIMLKSFFQHKHLVSAILICLTFNWSDVVPASATEPGSVFSETITGKLTTSNGFAWRYGYDIELQDGKLIVSVAVNLIAADGVTVMDLNRVRSAWEEAIEGTWSEKFALSLPSGRQCPIVVDVRFDALKCHHDVIVYPSGCSCNQLNWDLTIHPAIAAHEFGHMLGAFDEYRGGALSPHSRTIDLTSIMTSRPIGGMTYARHYLHFLRWFEEKTALDGVTLVRMDKVQSSRGKEPSLAARQGLP
jgi:hypothetical protein